MKADKNQQTAITLGTGPALISAGPGSGKTFVLIRRIKYLICNLGIPPSEILVLTFSKAAAEEMRDRFCILVSEEKLKIDPNEIFFGTFHALFYRILIKYDSEHKSHIISEQEKLKLMYFALEKNGVNLLSREFASLLIEEAQSFKSRDLPVRKYESKHLEKELFQKVIRDYERSKKEQGFLDFDDILTNTRDFLYQHPEILRTIQNRFRYLLIDEFQDINPVQYEVVCMLADNHKNIFAVGDDDQSIYAFRGANPSIMKDFLNDYQECKHIVLPVNYRSASEIVKKAEKVIRNNKNRIPKQIIAASEEKGTVEIKCFPEKYAEYKNLSLKILELSPCEYPETAIILRTNEIPPELIRALKNNHIPFCSAEKPVDLSEHPVTKDMLAYLRLSGKADLFMDAVDFFRVCNKPSRYIPFGYTGKNGKISFAELYRVYSDRPYLIRNLKEFHKNLKKAGDSDLFPAILSIVYQAGYMEYLQSKPETNYQTVTKRSESREKEIEILETLIDCAKDMQTVSEWLDALKEMSSVSEIKKDGVRIITMHSSKGLEYQNVFIPDLTEGNIPAKQAVRSGEIEEERRLFYVAVTRAKKRLFLYSVQKGFRSEYFHPSAASDPDKKTEQQLLSRFFREII